MKIVAGMHITESDILVMPPCKGARSRFLMKSAVRYPLSLRRQVTVHLS